MQPDDIGECIYCGSKNDLSTEHIVPYGLGGEDVLLNASCSDCAQITSEIEYEVLHNQVMQLRSAYNLPSRNNSVPEKLPLDILVNQDDEKRVHFPTADHPTLAMFLLYPLPGVLGGRIPKEGISIIGTNLYQVGGPDLEEFAGLFDIEEIRFNETFVGNNFERLLAKIALGFGVEKYGLDELKQSPVRSTILGEKDDAGKWIGCGQFNPKASDNMHQIDLEMQGDWILATVRLFAKASTPEYIVVLRQGADENKPQIANQTESGSIEGSLGDNVEVSQNIEFS